MTKHQLTVQPRQVLGRKVKSLRSQNLVPGHVFGLGVPTVNIQVSNLDLRHAYKQVGESSLLYLQVGSEPAPRPVFITDLTIDPVTSAVLHVSFHQVNLKEKITAPVSIELIGESPAVRDHLGVLVQQLNAIDVEALPTDMPEHIEVDISVLDQVDTSISVKDLKLASTLSVQTDPEAMIVKIEPLAKEEVVEVPAEAPVTEGAEEGVTPTEPSTPSEATPTE